MNYFLFAGNRHYPEGGAEDLVGVYIELSDENIFAALVDLVQKKRLYADDRIWVNALAHDGKDLGVRRHWEFRMEKDLAADALQFCTIKENIEGLGPCGLMPLGRQVDEGYLGDIVSFYPLLDAEKRDISYLP